MQEEYNLYLSKKNGYQDYLDEFIHNHQIKRKHKLENFENLNFRLNPYTYAENNYQKEQK